MGKAHDINSQKIVANLTNFHFKLSYALNILNIRKIQKNSLSSFEKLEIFCLEREQASKERAQMLLEKFNNMQNSIATLVQASNVKLEKVCHLFRNYSNPMLEALSIYIKIDQIKHLINQKFTLVLSYINTHINPVLAKMANLLETPITGEFQPLTMLMLGYTNEKNAVYMAHRTLSFVIQIMDKKRTAFAETDSLCDLICKCFRNA